MLGQISLGKWGMLLGGALAIVGFVAYGAGNATLNLAGFFYGIPIFLGGLALKAAELRPTPYSQTPTPDVLALRDRQATPTLGQLRKNVTRYRYGHEAHLDESLEKLGLSPTDEERPVLLSVREAVVEGAYAFVLEFDSPCFDLAAWQERVTKIERFFGPGIRADISQPDEDAIAVALVVIPAESVKAA
ncbi:protein of unknown function (DUF2854) [Rubidibacter lacunae KORDI 51-2]|uniref:DUF2854 domain-containing protein n=1 Tax=Rubidibacter lacunae KORDI 51-2 TaxID=582515 RepID=U5D523_9CHRO|nr:DUF2854 domain-containing protein [Rubidibacter lacunae]ERN39783.1 protein of unknown function (DUF2854) [Rubidibacter lacunae KORDI 51-2]